MLLLESRPWGFGRQVREIFKKFEINGGETVLLVEQNAHLALQIPPAPYVLETAASSFPEQAGTRGKSAHPRWLLGG